MKERPIIFSTEMVKAILDGRKTMSRRVIKPQPVTSDGMIAKSVPIWLYPSEFVQYSPHGQVGDRLWVRETLRKSKVGIPTRYSADDCPVFRDGETPSEWSFRTQVLPAIFMPRWASRLTLEITDIKVEKLNSMTVADAHLEGVDNLVTFMLLWDRLNKKRGYEWTSNCWVWVLTFKLCQ